MTETPSTAASELIVPLDGRDASVRAVPVAGRVAARLGLGVRLFAASDDDGSESKIDFKKLVAEFEGRALDTVYSEEVPVSFRRYVTDYFDRVKPPEEE